MAEVSATLIGLFFVGVFFYVDSGLRRLEHVRPVFEPYLRAGTRITLIVFANGDWTAGGHRFSIDAFRQ
jgi:hypothetical protein